VPTFPIETVTAVLAHMNGDHDDDNLLIARAFGDPAADAASMTGLDEHAGEWGYTVAGESRSVRVPWTAEISERAEIRREVVVVYDRACSILGITPRPH
jgi:hypothetical protein